MTPREKCFTVTIDGKKYGPYLDKYRVQFSSLDNLLGISIETIWLESGWVAPPLPPATTKRPRKDTSTPLLDGVGFCADTARRQRGLEERNLNA